MADFPEVPQKMAPVNADRQNCFVQGRGYILIEVGSKPHLRLNGCVVSRIEILTY